MTKTTKKWTYEVTAQGEFGGFRAQLIEQIKDDGTRGPRAIFVSALAWQGDRQPRTVIDWYPGLPFDLGEGPAGTGNRDHERIWMDWFSVLTPRSITSSFYGDDVHQQNLFAQWLFH